MKTHLKTSETPTCPFCAENFDEKKDKFTVLNTITGEMLVDCRCGERYFTMINLIYKY